MTSTDDKTIYNDCMPTRYEPKVFVVTKGKHLEGQPVNFDSIIAAFESLAKATAFKQAIYNENSHDDFLIHEVKVW